MAQQLGVGAGLNRSTCYASCGNAPASAGPGNARQRQLHPRGDQRVWLQKSNYIDGATAPHAGRLIIRIVIDEAGAPIEWLPVSPCATSLSAI
jgi:hypothetical protein